MLECVPNVSEGRDRAVLEALARACGPPLLDLHVDGDHHRSVFTLAARAGADTVAATQDLALAVAEHVDLRTHRGVHPRLGALDVVPFVALDGEAVATAVDAARDFAEWIVAELGVPVFFYDGADLERRGLPHVRRDAFVARAPDLGPGAPDPRLGAVAVGARPPLVAVNCELARDDLPLARAHRARRARTRRRPPRGPGAGIAARHGRAHASVDEPRGPRPHGTARRVPIGTRAGARAAGTEVARVELVGLVPAAELARCDAEFLEWAGLGAEQTLEHRLANVRR